MKLSFIGLGVMGYPMAGFLSKAGHDVTVFNRTTSKAEKWCAEYHGNLAVSPKEAAKSAEIAFICVGNDDDVREVILDEEGAIHPFNHFFQYPVCCKYRIVMVKPTCPARHLF